MTEPTLYLASQSPRRQEILTQLGISYQTLTIDVCEDRLQQEDISAYVLRLAQLKASTGLASPLRSKPLPVLGADTIVVIENKVLGKPKDKSDAQQMLMQLSDKRHQVFTAVAVCDNHRCRLAVKNDFHGPYE